MQICGILLLTVPTIQYGGYFLLKVLSRRSGTSLTEFQRSMFRAGHAHAGVLVLLSLVAELLTDHSGLTGSWMWLARDGFPAAAILVSGGFFASAAGGGRTVPNRWVIILYLGILILAVSTLTLGIALIRNS